MTEQPRFLPDEQLGPAERLLDVVLNSSAHLWHNRPGVSQNGVWKPAKGHSGPGERVQPGLFVPAAVELYEKLLSIYQLNVELMAHFASYALLETDWRDLKVACAALMLVQPRSGEPVHDDDGTVAFHDDDFRVVGEAMLLHYKRKSARMMTPKAVLRVGELLEVPEIAELNRRAGFTDAAGRNAPLGRWRKAATKWLEVRETNPAMLQGLVKAGYKETIKNLARKVGYKPKSEDFFAILGWKQKQSEEGHRTMGLDGLQLQKKERFDDLSEAEICEIIESQRLDYKEAVGRLPEGLGLTPAIMVALLPSLSDKEVRILSPTLEELGLLNVPEIRDRWEEAIEASTDQRALNVAKNLKNEELREKLEEAASHAAKHAVEEATKDLDVHVLFLIDRSGSMQGAIEKSKEALVKILAGFPPEKLHIVSFSSIGFVHRPKAYTRAGIEHMLSGIGASGGTHHSAGIIALAQQRVALPQGAQIVMIVVGDEDGESGQTLASTIRQCGYRVSAIALMENVAWRRGTTLRDCSTELDVPFTEVKLEQFDDPYQVPRVLKAILDAPRLPGARQYGFVQRVMSVPILTRS